MNYSSLPRAFSSPHTLASLSKNEPILLGFSGGADSSALLHMLAEYSKNVGCKLYAAHVNHGIRGAEADRDEEFCRQTADSLGVPIFVLRTDVPSIAKESGDSIETAARRVRYEFFAKLMRENSIPLLATAHNANDNLETVIFNLARGTGLDGLCGIPPVRTTDGGTLVRPILGMSREDILAYCRENSLSYVTDSTNTDTEYARNRIRADALPALISANGAAVRNAFNASELLRSDAEFLQGEADKFLSKSASDGRLSLTDLNSAPAAIARRAIIGLYERVSDTALGHGHVESILRLAERAVPHSRIELPMNTEAVIEDGLMIRKRQKTETISDYEIPLSEPSVFVSQTNCEIFIGNSQKKINIYKTAILLYIDFDKIKGVLKVRSRREGDRILEHGMHKSIKKMMCDKKIPLELRKRLPIICDDSGIVAVPSLSVRDGISAHEGAKNALLLQIYLY